jgi:hypothetical protein
MSYPQTAGYKTPGTSEDAARAITPKTSTLRDDVLTILSFYPQGLTPDEAARIIGRDILSIRPRFSELAQMGLIRDSGKRHRNASGKSAVVWCRWIHNSDPQAKLF